MDLKKLTQYTKDIKLLYVEDNLEARESTLELLSQFFDDITIAVNGAEGYEKFIENKDKLDLVITDISMPKLSGIDMIYKIRDTQSEIPVIIFSALEDRDNHINSVKLNISFYLNKPIILNRFKAIITKVIKKILIAKIHEEFK